MLKCVRVPRCLLHNHRVRAAPWLLLVAQTPQNSPGCFLCSLWGTLIFSFLLPLSLKARWQSHQPGSLDSGRGKTSQRVWPRRGGGGREGEGGLPGLDNQW